MYFSEAMSGVVLLDSFLCCRTVSVECAGEAGLVDDKTVDIKRVKATVQNLPVGHVVVTIYRSAD